MFLIIGASFSTSDQIDIQLLDVIVLRFLYNMLTFCSGSAKLQQSRQNACYHLACIEGRSSVRLQKQTNFGGFFGNLERIPSSALKIAEFVSEY